MRSSRERRETQTSVWVAGASARIAASSRAKWMSLSAVPASVRSTGSASSMSWRLPVFEFQGPKTQSRIASTASWNAVT